MAAYWNIFWADQTKLDDNGNLIFHDLYTPDPMDDFSVIEPELSLEINTPGTLTFSILPTHPYYSAIKNLRHMVTIEVMRGIGDASRFYWAGHPISIEQDLYGTLKYTCEGIMGYLSDVYARPFSRTLTASGWLSFFLGERYDAQLKNSADICTIIGDDEDQAAQAKSICKHRSFLGYHISKKLQNVISAQIGDDEETSTSYVDETIEEAELKRYSNKCLPVLELLKTRISTPLGGFFSVDTRYPADAEDGENYGLYYGDEDNRQQYDGRWVMIYKPIDTEPIDQLFEVGVNVISVRQEENYTDLYTGIVPVDGSGNSYCSYLYDYDASSLAFDLNSNTTADVFKPADSQAFYKRSLYLKYGSITKTVDMSSAQSEAEDKLEAKLNGYKDQIDHLVSVYQDATKNSTSPENANGQGINLPMGEEYPDIDEVERVNRSSDASNPTYPHVTITYDSGESEDCFDAIRKNISSAQTVSSDRYRTSFIWRTIRENAAIEAFRLTEPPATVEVQVVDLSMIDDEAERIRIGCLVPVKLSPVEQTRNFVVESMKIRFDDPTQNTITLDGTLPKLTSIVR